MTPETVEELVEAVQDFDAINISGENTHWGFRLPETRRCVHIPMTGISGVTFFNPDDQVVVVRAGTLLKDLQEQLATKNHCLPLILEGGEGTVGGAFSMNLPHSLEAECGNWRDWTLGLTVLRADGTLAKAGSMAVKNVAGYDVQKLLCGARGTLGIVTELILKTYPIKSLPTPKILGRVDKPNWIQRVLPTDFEQAWSAAQAFPALAYPNSSVIQALLPDDATLPRFKEDWVLRRGQGVDNLKIEDPNTLRLMLKAKAIFDPTYKLNPGEMGVF